MLPYLASELMVVLPWPFIKVNLDLCAHAQLVDSAETKSKVVENARSGRTARASFVHQR